MTDYKATLITGVIGEDVHVTGIRILEHALRSDGFEVHSLGIHNSQQDFIDAAIEHKADAILISSLAGHAEMLVQDFRKNCEKAGLKDIKLYIGGQLIIHAEEWSITEKRFHDQGFDSVAIPFNLPQSVITELNTDLCQNEKHQMTLTG